MMSCFSLVLANRSLCQQQHAVICKPVPESFPSCGQRRKFCTVPVGSILPHIIGTGRKVLSLCLLEPPIIGTGKQGFVPSLLLYHHWGRRLSWCLLELGYTTRPLHFEPLGYPSVLEMFINDPISEVCSCQFLL